MRTLCFLLFIDVARKFQKHVKKYPAIRQFCVKFSGNPVLDAYLSLVETVDNLLEQLSKKTGIPVEHMTLIYKGKPVRRTATLYDFAAAQDGRILMLMCTKSRGGGKKRKCTKTRSGSKKQNCAVDSPVLDLELLSLVASEVQAPMLDVQDDSSPSTLTCNVRASM